MSVSCEFKWKLKCGLSVIVEAESTYYPQDNEVWPVALSFVTPFETEGNALSILKDAYAEIDQIKEHAVICLCEQGREEVRAS